MKHNIKERHNIHIKIYLLIQKLQREKLYNQKPKNQVKLSQHGDDVEPPLSTKGSFKELMKKSSWTLELMKKLSWRLQMGVLEKGEVDEPMGMGSVEMGTALELLEVDEPMGREKV